jgi:hypothetical protein
MGDGELPRLLKETESQNFLPVPVAILRGSASFWNELEVGSHYVGKQGPTSTPSPTPDSAKPRYLLFLGVSRARPTQFFRVSVGALSLPSEALL